MGRAAAELSDLLLLTSDNPRTEEPMEIIRQIESGTWPAEDNPLKHAPHTQADFLGDWNRPYSRAQAVFPLPWVAENKFWPSVNRIDDVYGDRNLFCACVPMSDYAE